MSPMPSKMRGKIPKGMSVDEWADSLPAEQGDIVKQLRMTIKQAASEVPEVVKWGWPWYELNAPIAFIIVAGDHINLQLYRGNELESGKVKLEGTGKSIRHVKIFKAAELKAMPIADLIRESVVLDAARVRGPRRKK